jgi:hypothetical protein
MGIWIKLVNAPLAVKTKELPQKTQKVTKEL